MSFSPEQNQQELFNRCLKLEGMICSLLPLVRAYRSLNPKQPGQKDPVSDAIKNAEALLRGSADG